MVNISLVASQESFSNRSATLLEACTFGSDIRKYLITQPTNEAVAACPWL
jgi:hypothetical protein